MVTTDQVSTLNPPGLAGGAPLQRMLKSRWNIFIARLPAYAIWRLPV